MCWRRGLCKRCLQTHVLPGPMCWCCRYVCCWPWPMVPEHMSPETSLLICELSYFHAALCIGLSLPLENPHFLLMYYSLPFLSTFEKSLFLLKKKKDFAVVSGDPFSHFLCFGFLPLAALESCMLGLERLTRKFAASVSLFFPCPFPSRAGASVFVHFLPTPLSDC